MRRIQKKTKKANEKKSAEVKKEQEKRWEKKCTIIK